VSDTVIVVPNDRLLDSVGKLPVRQAFKVSDEVPMRSVKGITELITMPGLVNLDFADVRTVMEKGGVAMIGLGESDSDSKAQDSVKSALRSPLLDVDISSANSALVNVTGGTDMSIEEAEGVVEEIYDRIDPDARIIWGTSVDEELEGEMRTMIVVTGVESPQIYGPQRRIGRGRRRNARDGRHRLRGVVAPSTTNTGRLIDLCPSPSVFIRPFPSASHQKVKPDHHEFSRNMDVPYDLNSYIRVLKLASTPSTDEFLQVSKIAGAGSSSSASSAS